MYLFLINFTFVLSSYQVVLIHAGIRNAHYPFASLIYAFTFELCPIIYDPSSFLGKKISQLPNSSFVNEYYYLSQLLKSPVI